jgi:hypothetical protein
MSTERSTRDRALQQKGGRRRHERHLNCARRAQVMFPDIAGLIMGCERSM